MSQGPSGAGYAKDEAEAFVHPWDGFSVNASGVHRGGTGYWSGVVMGGKIWGFAGGAAWDAIMMADAPNAAEYDKEFDKKLIQALGYGGCIIPDSKVMKCNAYPKQVAIVVQEKNTNLLKKLVFSEDAFTQIYRRRLKAPRQIERHEWDAFSDDAPVPDRTPSEADAPVHPWDGFYVNASGLPRGGTGYWSGVVIGGKVWRFDGGAAWDAIMMADAPNATEFDKEFDKKLIQALGYGGRIIPVSKVMKCNAHPKQVAIVVEEKNSTLLKKLVFSEDAFTHRYGRRFQEPIVVENDVWGSFFDLKEVDADLDEKIVNNIAFRKKIQAVWEEHRAKAQRSANKFDEGRDAAMAAATGSSIEIADEHFQGLFADDWLVNLETIPEVHAKMMHDNTGTEVNFKSHLRTFDFVLQGCATLKIVNEQADDLSSLFVNDDHLRSRKFVRACVTIPTNSVPKFGGSRYLCTKKSEQGSLLTPTLPVNFTEFWKSKVAGHAKYGPTFVQFINPCKASSHPSDKITAYTEDGKTVIVPLPDKSQPTDGGERVVVRGGLEIENLQRMKFTFARQSNGTTLYEVIDGYVEKVSYNYLGQLEFTLLVPHEEDLLQHALPFGPSHPAPKHFYHHHNCHSRVFNVEPMSGKKLIELAGSDGKLIFPEGTVMEYTIVGIACACVAGVAAIAGCAVAAAGGAAAAVIACGAVAAGAALVGDVVESAEHKAKKPFG